VTEFSRSHLTTREIEEAAAGTLSAVRQAHADQCAQCAEAIEDYRFVAARMPRGETSLEDAGGCPAAEDLALACSGSLAGPEAARVIEHASSCGRCGAILRVVMEEEPAPVAAVKPRRRTLWLAAAAALALGFIGLFLWFQERHDPRRLLAMAYTESRPFDLRLRDNGYGPVRQQRAGSASALDRPRALVQAEGDIQGRPESAETLLLRGRAELLEGQYDAAIESLTRAQETRKGNAEAMADLGCAYLLRGDTENRAIDYGHGLDYLRGAVKLQPNDVRILFDLALAYERTALLEAAIETWKRYLALEKDAGWAAEARQRLGGIEARVKKVLGWRQRVQPDPTAFLAMARADAGAVDAEQFQDIAWRYWLPASAENTQARAAFTTLARMFVERFGDTSLADSATGGTTAGLEMLGQAIGKDAEGAYDEALPLARNAARVLEESANRAAALRARVEMVNSRARAPSAECLAVTAPVRKALAGTKYRWMLAQTTIQEGICSLRGGLSGAARQLYREAEEATRKQGLRILWLRVTGMQGDQAQLTGDEVGVWEIAETGL